MRSEESVAEPGVCGEDSPFLALPLEIRLQIYGWVHLMHPIQHAQLAPWYPTPIHSAYFHTLIKPDVKTEDVPAGCQDPKSRIINGRQSEGSQGQGGREDALLSPDRPLSGIPSALMRASRQVCDECRTIPFQDNEFVFVNWFSSGLWAARAFTRSLKPWQLDNMRFARLEMLGRDFTGPALKEWVELCGCWASGLRGLRLKILIGGGIFEPTATFAALNNNAGAQAIGLSSRRHCPEPKPEWIEEGLKRITALRWLEVELSVLDWEDEEKVEWCAELERILNAGKEGEGAPGVVVRCVEKLTENRGPKRQVGGDAEKN